MLRESPAAASGEFDPASKWVGTIPHVAEPPPGLHEAFYRNGLGGIDALRPSLRRKHGMPTAAFVVLVNCGNYDAMNRKALDVAVLAFKALRETVTRAHLFLRVVSTAHILAAEGNALPEQHTADPASSLAGLLRAAGLPAGSFTVEDRVLDWSASWEMLAAADVLLMPSKSEGFGLPLLEAQRVGTPAVTTAFGAMADYTWHGLSVPFVQRSFLSDGFAAMPSVAGTADALRRVAAGELSAATREAAARRIRSELSSAAETWDPSELDWFVKARVQDAGAVAALLKRDRQRLSAEARGLAASDPLPAWVLVCSDRVVLREGALAVLKRGGWHTKLPNTNVFFLLTRRADGTLTPKEADLQRGKLPQHAVVLVRTSRYLAAARALSVPPRKPSEIRVREVLEATLRGVGSTLGATLAEIRPRCTLGMKLKHDVVADHIPS